jgi:hypothetical protein
LLWAIRQKVLTNKVCILLEAAWCMMYQNASLL